MYLLPGILGVFAAIMLWGSAIFLARHGQANWVGRAGGNLALGGGIFLIALGFFGLRPAGIPVLEFAAIALNIAALILFVTGAIAKRRNKN